MRAQYRSFRTKLTITGVRGGRKGFQLMILVWDIKVEWIEVGRSVGKESNVEKELDWIVEKES
jgi:hypothetical protein